ncbi:hypothetical protein ACFVUY_24815 [Kitasatospora sp. NPDC058063]
MRVDVDDAVGHARAVDVTVALRVDGPFSEVRRCFGAWEWR